jgi:hypothetical protein
MRRMPDDEPTPVERTELRSLDDLFQTFTTLASDDDMLLLARWYDSLLHAPSPFGGNSRHFVHGGILLGPAGAGDGPRQSAVMPPLCMRLATPISFLGKEDRLLRHRWQCKVMLA